ncbi:MULTISPECIES: oligosaccharide flippase family protein [Eubacteriales]|uniref:oligosaccharide flippase family protein n=1 Tax=Eubacteriales TaxID=186802 RepID=UPI0011069121|nr:MULTISPECIES: oligosaccharide flippase family protein [Eubacteriales]
MGKQIKLGAIISYFALAINIVVTLFYTPWMVSKIGRANYGLYTLAISLIGIFMLDFGLSSAVARFLAKYRAENQQNKINEFIGAVFKLYFLIDLIIFIILTVVYFSLETIYAGLTPEELKLFRVLYLVVGGFNLLAFPMTPLSGVLNAYEQFAALKLCDLFNKLFTVVLVIGALLLNFGVVAVVSANAIAGIITILIKISIIKKKIPFQLKIEKIDKKIYKEIFSFSIWSTVISIAQRLTYNLAPSILAVAASSIAVALYSPASSIGSYYYMIATAINGLFLPSISRMISEKKENQILTLMIKVGRYQTFLLGMILVGFFCVGDIFMTLWMGKDFYESYYCTVLIMIPAFFEYSQQIANTTIIAKNCVKDQAIWVMCTSLVGVCISYVLAKTWGAEGTCVALCIVGLINVLGLNVIHKKKIGIDILTFYKNCYGKMLVPMILTMIIGRVIVRFVEKVSIITLIAEGLLVVAIYIVLMWTISLSVDEKDYVIKGSKRLCRR